MKQPTFKPLYPGQIVQTKKQVVIWSFAGFKKKGFVDARDRIFVDSGNILLVLSCKRNGFKRSEIFDKIKESSWRVTILYEEKRYIFASTWSEIEAYLEHKTDKILEKSNG
jgi:hypothetical protein